MLFFPSFKHWHRTMRHHFLPLDKKGANTSRVLVPSRHLEADSLATGQRSPGTEFLHIHPPTRSWTELSCQSCISSRLYGKTNFHQNPTNQSYWNLSRDWDFGPSWNNRWGWARELYWSQPRLLKTFEEKKRDIYHVSWYGLLQIYRNIIFKQSEREDRKLPSILYQTKNW